MLLVEPPVNVLSLDFKSLPVREGASSSSASRCPSPWMCYETREVLANLDLLEVQVILAKLLEMSWFQYGYEVLDSQLGLLLDKRPAFFTAQGQVV
jgi:hypothetical protein